MKTIYLIIPCYNEEEALPATMQVILEKMRSMVGRGKISGLSRVVLINDGSRDKTWDIISGLSRENETIIGIKLSRNRGTQNALAAGYEYARHHCDAAISTDADLQDDPDAIERMIDCFEAGADVVYGVRSKRETDTAAKRGTAQMFYKFMKLLGSESVYDHSDYRLLSKRALDALSEYGEQNMFIRDITPLIGFKQDIVTYERRERVLGESKYNYAKLLRLALDGLYSASIKPARIISASGILLMLLSGLLLIWFIIGQFVFCFPILSWRIVLFALILIGGFITLAIGVAAEYAARAFFESKRRPRYHIETICGNPDNK